MIGSKMYTEALQNVQDFCDQCESMVALRERYKNNPHLDTDEDKIALGDMRKQCSRCRGIFGGGIYKADAILAAVRVPKLPPGKGRACTIPMEIQEKIFERYNAGETQQEIADSIGISRSRVQRVIRLTTLNEQNPKFKSGIL